MSDEYRRVLPTMYGPDELPMVGDVLVWVLRPGDPVPPATTLLPGTDEHGRRVCWKRATYAGPQIGHPFDRLFRGVVPCGLTMARSVTNGVPGTLYCAEPAGHDGEHVSDDGWFRLWERGNRIANTEEAR